MKKLLVSNAAGTISQSIARVVRESGKFNDCEIVGMLQKHEFTNSKLYDELVLAPSTYNEVDGVDHEWFSEILNTLDINLAVPTTDYETVGWSYIKIPSTRFLLVSDQLASEAYYDKWLNAELFSKNNIPFARSCLPSNYHDEFPKALVKPRKGGLSRGVIGDYFSAMKFPDSYIVQEVLRGPEFTFCFYVTQRGNILGPLVLERELRYGMTSVCIVRDDLYLEASRIAEQMTVASNIVGPCNVQCRIGDNGQMVPFEVNCRYSGTCGIRHDIGFHDVLASLNEYIYGIDPQLLRITQGGGFKRIIEYGTGTLKTWNELRAI